MASSNFTERGKVMGREVKRVPLEFDFPIDASYANTQHDLHRKSCLNKDHDDCDVYSHPPKGEGWQLWQTVSDGPVTPVFATADELIDYMSQPCDCGERWCEDPWPTMPAGKGWRRPVAEKFVRGRGWMPSLMLENGRPLSTSETVDILNESKQK
jgi:hypothetical protein